MLRKSRVILLAICLMAAGLFVIRNLGQNGLKPRALEPTSSSDTGDSIRVKIDRSLMTESDLEELTQIKSCPVCFGEDLCPELAGTDLEVRNVLYTPEDVLPPVYQVYKGLDVKYWIRPASSNGHVLTSLASLDQAVCQNASVFTEGEPNAKNCHVGLTASNSFLYSFILNEKSLRNLYKTHLSSRHWVPMTACPSYKLMDGLVQSFDENRDHTLTAKEKAMLITSISTNPDLVAYKLIVNQQIRIPHLNLYGSCGRVTLIEGEFRPLSKFLDHSLELRKGLAAQLLAMIDTFLNEDPNWVLFMTEITMDNLVVTKSGEVAFLDFSRLMFIDRDFLDEDFKAERKKCDFDCLEAFQTALIQSEETTPCYQIRPYLEYMYALVCRNILSDADIDRKSRFKQDQRGLLHNVHTNEEDHEIKSLIRECVDESELGGRVTAFMNLQELMQVVFKEDDLDDESDDRGDDQGDYDEGNVVHIKEVDNIDGSVSNPAALDKAEKAIELEKQALERLDPVEPIQYTPPPGEINIA
ncbi:uncharacterized protein LOC131883574 [Tigriopus californicus]|uniref:uncharacterized protein LOC131883574 n=1 Tax=Tigriopus californicus TaxID=6832 RepID=UPI0027DA6707|nr:uncharacterized protein LOC131883574 [Tigriopus californicus]